MWKIIANREVEISIRKHNMASIIQKYRVSYKSIEYHTKESSITEKYRVPYKSIVYHTTVSRIIQQYHASYNSIEYHTKVQNCLTYYSNKLKCYFLNKWPPSSGYENYSKKLPTFSRSILTSAWRLWSFVWRGLASKASKFGSPAPESE